LSNVKSLQKNPDSSSKLLNLQTTIEAFQPVSESEECQHIFP
jgi:hypothetical protein